MPYKIKDLTGKKIHKFIVLREFNEPCEGLIKRRKTIRKLECQCDCGQKFYPYKSNVLAGHTTGCQNCGRANDLTGKRVGKFEFIERFWKMDGKPWSRVNYRIKCDCGNIFESPAQTARKLKGFLCKKCPRKPKPVPFDEAIKKTNFLKHLKSKEMKIGKISGRLKVTRFHGWEYKNNRRYSLYEYKCKCGKKIIRRGDFLGRIFSCGCLHHENVLRGEKNSQSRLTNKEAAQIRELLKLKIYTQRQIAKMYSVIETVISSIKKGKTYKI